MFWFILHLYASFYKYMQILCNANVFLQTKTRPFLPEKDALCFGTKYDIL